MSSPIFSRVPQHSHSGYTYTDRLEWDSSAIDRVHHLCDGNPYYETLIAQQLWLDMRPEFGPSLLSGMLMLRRPLYLMGLRHLISCIFRRRAAPEIDHTSRTALMTSAVLQAVRVCGG